jgi:hypothetical protein
MGLLTLPFRLPLLPVKAFMRLAVLLYEQAEREQSDPAEVRHQLEEVAEARDAGVVSEDEVSKVEYEAVGRMVRSAPAPPPDGAADQEG